MSYILNEFGFFRVAVVTPKLQVANVLFNLRCIKVAIDNLVSQHVQLAVFPELCITGYSCGDLFYQETLLYESQRAIIDLASYLANRKISIIVGVPLLFNSRLYNCAVFINDGKIIGVVPKMFLPTTQEYYEQRWFTSGWNVRDQSIDFYGEYIPFGVDLIFKVKNFPLCLIGIEICEDLWSPQPPSGDLVLAGATIIANVSASNEIVGKCAYRRNLVSQQSARCVSAYLYASAGPGESTSDTVYSGHSIISENGIILAQTERFCFDTQIAIADIDLQQIKNERIINSSYSYAETTKNSDSGFYNA